MTALRQWVCWRLEPNVRSGHPAKVPYSPHSGKRASASNPATWGSLEETLACAERYQFSGIGFAFTAESGIVGIDIDRCLDRCLGIDAYDITPEPTPDIPEVDQIALIAIESDVPYDDRRKV